MTEHESDELSRETVARLFGRAEQAPEETPEEHSERLAAGNVVKGEGSNPSGPGRARDLQDFLDLLSDQGAW